MTKTNIITESLMAIIDNEASTDQGPTLKATEAQAFALLRGTPWWFPPKYTAKSF